MITRYTPGNMTGAQFSECGRYRYSLWRRWATDPLSYIGCSRWCNFIMLNPSTADEETNDPTVERCERRARKWGYGGLFVTNIFAWRSTDPANMKAALDPIGPDNDKVIRETAKIAELVVCAWGNHGSYMHRDAAVRRLLADIPVHALRVSKTRQPQHPLYLPYSLKPVRYAA